MQTAMEPTLPRALGRPVSPAVPQNVPDIARRASAATSRAVSPGAKGTEEA